MKDRRRGETEKQEKGEEKDKEGERKKKDKTTREEMAHIRIMKRPKMKKEHRRCWEENLKERGRERRRGGRPNRDFNN